MRSTWLALVAVLAAPEIAHSEPKSRELLFSASVEYVVPPSCPSAEEFKAIVTARLGFDPFVEDARDHVLVSIEEGSRNLDGRLEWRDEAGKWAGDRAFPAHTTDCAELVRAMGFALAVQINLLAASRPRDASRDGSREPDGAKPADSGRDARQPRGTPAQPSGARPAGARPGAASDRGTEPDTDTEADAGESGSSTPWVFGLGAGGTLALCLSPSVLPLGRVFGSAGWGSLSFELGGELSTRSVDHRATDGAGYGQQLLLGSLAVCGSAEPFGLCALIKAGAVKVGGRSVDVPASPSGSALQAGLRFGVRERLGRHVFIGQRIEGLFNLTRWSVTLDQVPVWTAPILSAGLGLDVGAFF
jgi:hypothetical protein